jgi:hypothetical protein
MSISLQRDPDPDKVQSFRIQADPDQKTGHEDAEKSCLCLYIVNCTLYYSVGTLNVQVHAKDGQC